MAPITSVIKRTGAVVPFSQDRIATRSIAAVSVGGRDRAVAGDLAAGSSPG